MSATISELRPGTYFDSVVLMQLQRELAQLPGVEDAGVVMATPANCDLLKSSGFPIETQAKADDLLIVVRAASEESAKAALAQVDELMARKRQVQSENYLPKSLQAAAGQLPGAGWVLISVPGRYAAKVAHDALDLHKNVFLFSDNVSLADEIALKRSAADKGLLVMGPDCGTAIINGIGLGFANRVARGNIGLLAASGTGLQVITSEIHRLGGGISQAIGTGGRDLHSQVGAASALAGMKLLTGDDQTEVIVLVSKPPDPEVTAKLMAAAWHAGKPVVIDMIGYPPPSRQIGPLFFASSLGDAAAAAVKLATHAQEAIMPNTAPMPESSRGRYIRALMAGGTIAYEVLAGLQSILGIVSSNLHVPGTKTLPNLWQSVGHTVLDLGEDLFTQGRLHPMMDNDYRIRRMNQEYADPDTALILLDLVLGVGAHANPASEIAPVAEQLLQKARQAGRALEIVCIVTGTDLDPQDLDSQIAQMESAGAQVSRDISRALAQAISTVLPAPEDTGPRAAAGFLTTPISAINVGLDIFTETLREQGAEVIGVDWRPPAGGDDRLASLLAKMK